MGAGDSLDVSRGGGGLLRVAREAASRLLQTENINVGVMLRMPDTRRISRVDTAAQILAHAHTEIRRMQRVHTTILSHIAGGLSLATVCTVHEEEKRVTGTDKVTRCMKMMTTTG